MCWDCLRTTQPAIRAFDPFLLRHRIIQFPYVGKLLIRSQDDRLGGLGIVPALHNATDVDGDEFAVRVDLISVVRFPRCLVRELHKVALDHTATSALFSAFCSVFIAGETIDRWCTSVFASSVVI